MIQLKPAKNRLKNLNREKMVNPLIEQVKKLLSDNDQRLIVMVRG